MLLTPEQAEEIVVLSRLMGITEAKAAAHLGYVNQGESRYPGDLGHWENTLQILRARKRLTDQVKEAHSQHTNKSED